MNLYLFYESTTTKNKSIENYIKLGYEYNSNNLNYEQLFLLKNISKIDESILILDDILDNSKIRNKNPCLYLEIGVEKAISISKEYKLLGINSLKKLIEISKTSETNKLEILEKLDLFFESIELGEKINLDLQNNNFYLNQIDLYFKMITLFTGNHIKFGLEIGQLLNNNKIDLNLSEISISVGIIRQIYDDFLDYFDEHHKPFGDFISSNKRLPELLFLSLGGNRDIIQNYLKSNDFKSSREIILNNEIRKKLFEYCKFELNKCSKLKTNFNYNLLFENFKDILK
jgi:geranylgeranyl pyrophosphate synthase